MNLLDCIVIEILDIPKFNYNKWWVKVKYNCYGQDDITNIMCQSEEEALEIKIGHKFLN